MKLSIKSYLSYISDLMLNEEWEIKIIVGPGKNSDLQEILKRINLDENIVLVLTKKVKDFT